MLVETNPRFGNRYLQSGTAQLGRGLVLKYIYVAKKTSLWWRDLAFLGDVSRLEADWFKQVVKKKLGNGASVKFWSDIWIGIEPLSALFP